MPNLTITNIDTGNVIFSDGEFRDELLTFAAGGTVVAGTILARSTATLKLVPYVKGGIIAGNGTPKTVLTYAVTAAAAGDESIRALVAGKVRKEKLIIDADGTGANIDNTVLDELRAFGIVPIDSTELTKFDNQ